MKYFKLVCLFAFLTICLVAPYKAYINDIPAHGTNIVDVKSGESINQVLSKFSSNTLTNKLFIRLFVRFNNINNIQSGEYAIDNLSIKEIIYKMRAGKTITHKIKILEGSTIYDVEDLINNSLLINDCSYLRCVETNYPFKEGILYPDTYYYKKGMNSSFIINKSHSRLNDFLEELFNKEPPSNSLNKYQILILASIIEKEAGNDNEKPDIGDVFLKRLSINMRLQADPTIIYGLLPNFDGDIKKSDILNKNNKYNTYMIYGLPPTPISISSISSINAAKKSSPGDYLFFVANSPTTHYFSKSYDEHLNKIKELGLNK
tara:strand:+ start:3335 stop:4288 length:954 start_codon:yes stop_codon:yes gene_type:complete